MTKSKIFLCLCLSFIGGIFLSSFFGISQLFLLVFLISGLILISVFWRYKRIAVVGFCVLFLVFGIWRHQVEESKIADNELRKHNDKEAVTFYGVVAKEPDFRETITRLLVEVDGLGGKVLITTNRYPEYRYGDRLQVAGNLESPPVFEDFNYRDYLKKDGIYSVMSWPEIKLEGSGFGNPATKLLLSFKNRFQETARTFVSSPQEGILEALLFGNENNISKEWKEKLNITGTRHITAVSGMNTTILAVIIMAFALSLGLWRKQAFYLSIFLLVLYILMIGAPASAVRAGIMAGILMTGQYLGRLSSASRALVFAGTLMLFFNPLFLVLDVGFQLSFLATFGIIYLQPLFSNWLKIIPNFKFFPIKTTLATTLSAQSFTLPILIFNFGYVPLTSPITNILIVPLLAPLSILIFIFGVSGMIFPILGQILSLPVWLLLTYLVKIIDWFSQLPLVSLTFKNVHWSWLIISYFILGVVTWLQNSGEKLRFLKF